MQGMREPERDVPGVERHVHDLVGIQPPMLQDGISGLHVEHAAIGGKIEHAELVAAWIHLQAAVFDPVRIDSQKGLHVRGRKITERAGRPPEPRILMEAECRVVGPRGLPGRLVGDLFEVFAEKRFHQAELTRIDPKALQERTYVSRPVDKSQVMTESWMWPNDVQ